VDAANALLVGGLTVPFVAFVGLRWLPNQAFWQTIGAGLLAAAVGFLAAPHARIERLAPLQQSPFFERSRSELELRATVAYLFLGGVQLAIAGWVLFIATRV
jgi:hypothetical protein